MSNIQPIYVPCKNSREGVCGVCVPNHCDLFGAVAVVDRLSSLVFMLHCTVTMSSSNIDALPYYDNQVDDPGERLSASWKVELTGSREESSNSFDRR